MIEKRSVYGITLHYLKRFFESTVCSTFTFKTKTTNSDWHYYYHHYYDSDDDDDDHDNGNDNTTNEEDEEFNSTGCARITL